MPASSYINVNSPSLFAVSQEAEHPWIHKAILRCCWYISTQCDCCRLSPQLTAHLIASWPLSIPSWLPEAWRMLKREKVTVKQHLTTNRTFQQLRLQKEKTLWQREKRTTCHPEHHVPTWQISSFDHVWLRAVVGRTLRRRWRIWISKLMSLLEEDFIYVYTTCAVTAVWLVVNCLDTSAWLRSCQCLPGYGKVKRTFPFIRP
jgi:hypothetical protein